MGTTFLGRTFRDYQLDCFQSIYSEMKAGISKQLAVQATGLGKRLQAVYISTKFKKSIFLAHREELIEQAYDDFVLAHGIMNVGIIKGNRFEIDKPIIVASPQTLHNRLNKIDNKHFDLVQYDEAHHYLAKTYVKCVQYFEPKLLVGWTATPYRLDNLSLSNLADKIVFDYGIDKGIINKYLAPLDAIKVETHISLNGVHKRGGDFAQGELSNTVNVRARNALIVERYKKHANNRSAICFCVDRAHCRDMAEVFNEHGITCGILTSDDELTPDRKGLIKAFKSGLVKVLINIDIATEGFDYSDVGAVLMARPTQSLALYMQMIGRGTRIKSDRYIQEFGTNSCMILDFVDNSGNHNLINTWVLDKGKSAKEKTFVSDENRKKLFEAEEKRAREAMIKTRVEKEIRVDLLKLPDVKVWNSERMLDAATDKQIDFLKSLGIYEEGVEYTKQMASEAIMIQPANIKQKHMLRKWGYDPTNATLGQFQKIKAEIDSKEKFMIK